jgi:hypothetical protein
MSHPAFVVRAVMCIVLAAVVAGSRSANAQEPPPPIGLFVVDFHGVVPAFGDNAELASSRPSLNQSPLPGAGLGISAAAHFYVLPKIVGIRVGLGGEAIIGRSSSSPNASSTSTLTPLQPVTEVFKEFSPQLSLNFGSGNGWSYLSAGIGRSVWSIVAEGGTPLPQDEDPIRTINYGGGARWFAKKRLAFSLDVRLYEIDAVPATATFNGSPRTVLLVIGAGISVR